MVATTPRDPVLQWAGYAQAAEKATGIPANVLLGLTRVESGGHEGETSGAGAGGLTQFIPSTAAAYGVDVRPGHARSQIFGTARYLKALGFDKDPVHALNAYNGAQTIGGKPNPYAGNVLAAAKRYGSLGSVSTGPTGSTTTPAATDTQPSSGPLIDDQKKSGALKALLTVATVIGGGGLVYIGANQTSGGSLHTAVKTATRAGEVAAAA